MFSIVLQDSWKFGSLLLLASEIRRSGNIDRGEVATSAPENSVPPCCSTEFTRGSFRMAVNRKLEFSMPLDTIMLCPRCFPPLFPSRCFPSERTLVVLVTFCPTPTGEGRTVPLCLNAALLALFAVHLCCTTLEMCVSGDLWIFAQFCHVCHASELSYNPIPIRSQSLLFRFDVTVCRE